MEKKQNKKKKKKKQAVFYFYCNKSVPDWMLAQNATAGHGFIMSKMQNFYFLDFIFIVF